MNLFPARTGPFFAEQSKIPCRLSPQHSAVCFTPQAIGIFQEDKLLHQLLMPTALQITYAYVHTRRTIHLF